MKKKYSLGNVVFLIAIISCVAIECSTASYTKTEPAQNQSLNNNNNVNPNMTNVTNVYVGITQEVISNLSSYASSFAQSIAHNIQEAVITTQQSIKNTVQKGVDSSEEAVHSLFNYVNNNKLRLSLYALVGGYAYLHYKIFVIQYALNKDTNWSLWNNAVQLEELFSVPQKQLGETIIKEAQRRYTLMENPEDFVTPLITFLREVEGERELLQTYITVSSWIKKLHLSKISWIDSVLESTCKERLQRLAYIKNVFLSWYAEHKFTRYAAAGM